MALRSSRGGSIGEAMLAVGGICLALGVLDFTIRLIIYVFGRMFRS